VVPAPLGELGGTGEKQSAWDDPHAVEGAEAALGLKRRGLEQRHLVGRVLLPVLGEPGFERRSRAIVDLDSALAQLLRKVAHGREDQVELLPVVAPGTEPGARLDHEHAIGADKRRAVVREPVPRIHAVRPAIARALPAARRVQSRARRSWRAPREVA